MSARPNIPQMEPWFDGAEATAVAEYFSGGGWITEFSKTEEFEREIGRFTGAPNCIVTNSGTISLSLALLALGIRAGDEVIVPDLTMIATPNAARMIGAVPIFADVEPSSLCMSPLALEGAFSSRTRAVIYVPLNGRPGSLQAILEICRRRNIPLIEDAAQALGSFFNGRHLGRFGSIGTISFSAPKIISTGQGGCLLTEDASLASKVRALKDFGRARGGVDVHESIGFNFKFTDLQAVVGLEQMKKLEWRIKRKKQIYERLVSELQGIGSLQFLDTDLSLTTPWFNDIYTPDREALIAFLKSKGIGTRVIYPPIHLQHAYGLTDRSFPVTEEFGAMGLWLPSSSKLTEEEVGSVCAAIREFFA